MSLHRICFLSFGVVLSAFFGSAINLLRKEKNQMFTYYVVSLSCVSYFVMCSLFPAQPRRVILWSVMMLYVLAPGRRQSKALSTSAERGPKSIETEFSIAICRQCGDN